jgi:hypothetical protein
MLHGTLLQQDNKWYAVLPSGDDFPAELDIWETHPQHKLWLLIHGKENMKTCFVLDKDNYAVLKSCETDKRIYAQD